MRQLSTRPPAGAGLTSDLLLLVVTILDTSKEDGRLVREDQAVLLQVGVTRIQHGVQHGLVEQEVAHPLRDDDVDLGEGHIDLLHLALDQGDLVGHTVGLDDLARLEDDGRHVDTDNVLRSSLDGEPALHLSYSIVVKGGVRGAYIDRMAVPQPTSRTTLSLKMCLFWMMAFMYERVRTSSFCSASLISPLLATRSARRGAMAGEGNTPTFPRECLYVEEKKSSTSANVLSIFRSRTGRTMVVVAVAPISSAKRLLGRKGWGAETYLLK